MSRAFVSAAARWSRFLAGWGALVVLGHFALDATAWAAERREAEENERALGKRDERALAMERAKNASCAEKVKAARKCCFLTVPIPRVGEW